MIEFRADLFFKNEWAAPRRTRLIIPQYLCCIVMKSPPMASVYIQNIFPRYVTEPGAHTQTVGYLKRPSLQRKWCHTNIWREGIFKGQLCFEARGNKPSLISMGISFSRLSARVHDWSRSICDYLSQLTCWMVRMACRVPLNRGESIRPLNRT